MSAKRPAAKSKAKAKSQSASKAATKKTKKSPAAKTVRAKVGARKSAPKVAKPKAAAKKAPAKKAPAKKAKKASAKKAPTKKAPVKKVPTKKAPANKVSAKKAPAKKAPPAKAPAKAPSKAAATPKTKAASRSRSSAPPPSTRPAARSSSVPPRSARDSDAPASGRPLSERPTFERTPLREPPRTPPTLVSLAEPITKNLTIEERAAEIEERLAKQSEDFRQRYQDSLDMSWIHHDSALEGVVYTFDELRSALSGEPMPVADSSLQPTYEDIRRYKEAIEYIRDFGKKQRSPVTVDVIKKIYLILKPSEGDLKTVKYRRDIPQHRLYFHEYAQPDKIAYRVRQVIDWLNEPETKKTRNGLHIAARAHYDLLRVFAFPTDSGRVARLFMNLLLLRSGLPPAIIHSAERQRYYDAIKGSANTVLAMVQEAVENALSSMEKLLDEHETHKRAFIS